MRFIGIDIASDSHVVAVVDERGEVQVRPAEFSEDVRGYEKLLGLLGPPGDGLVAMEATGHYWQNLFVRLAAEGYPVALINPLRTRRFAEGDLERTKTDAIDALGIARFAQQKRPTATRLPDATTQELRRSCASWCGSATGSPRTSRPGSTSSTAWSISASPSSRAT
jgi:transposase